MRTVRVLAILTKRQMSDDGPLLVAALIGAVLFLLALGAAAFIYPQGFLLHVGLLLIVLPFIVGAGFFFFGVVQTHGDENRGILSVLSALAVTPEQIVLARIATGIVFVVVTIIGLASAITGAVMSGLVQWPQSLVPEGIVDLSVALLLFGLACYSLGLLASRRAANWMISLRVLPLALAFISLIAVKGFAWPLAIILGPFFVASLVCLLASPRCSRLATITLGVLVVVMIAVPFYWLRFCSDTLTALVMLSASNDTSLSLYRDFRPTSGSYSRGLFTVRAKLGTDYSRIHFLVRPIGLIEYLQAKEPGGRSIDLRHFGLNYGLYYDEEKALLVDRSARGTFYVGPEGFSDAPTDRLGHFASLITYPPRYGRTPEGTYHSEQMIFDPQTRCFHQIDYGEQDVRFVLSLTDPTFQPVDPTRARLGTGICSVTCSYPSIRDQNAPYAEDSAGDYLPVVGESGAVVVIDERNRRLLPAVGYLPRPRTLFGRALSKPRDLLDYDVAVIVKRPQNEYAGLITASVSRQGTLATVAVFNKDGRLIDEAPRRSELSLAFLPMKCLTESLHPPVLTLASFFTAYSFDARATHRALFLMPNSFVALQRDRETGFIFQCLLALLFLLPALSFAGFLTWRVLRDATLLGLPRYTRWLWGTGTLAFGLPAYVTYRLTRPRAALALCRDCGRSRRVDQEVCHHCGSRWNVPVLEPPAWRVISS